MSGAVLLGRQPNTLEVEVAAGGDWSETLRAEVDGEPRDWPAGTDIVLEFRLPTRTVTWAAVCDGPHATFNVPQVEVDALVRELNGSRAPARLLHTLDGVRSAWATGRVEGFR